MITPNYIYKAKVVNVVDGDTVDADVSLGFNLKARLRLRLLRVNTPEMNSTDPVVRLAAFRAREYTASKIMNANVMIRTEKDDAFGRYLAEIWYELPMTTTGVVTATTMITQINLNDDLLQLGLAVPFKK